MKVIEGTEIRVSVAADPHRGILVQLHVAGDVIHAGPFRRRVDAEFWLGGFAAAVQWALNEPEEFGRGVMSRVGTEEFVDD